jgi:predicted nucleotidyltransferase component of viral defense system
MQSASWPRIKLDISQEEKVADDPIFLPLIHGYSDSKNCETTVMCYSLYEIFAEKMRALVQRTRPRDLYDVIHLADLFEIKKLDKNIFRDIAIKKFSSKGLKYPDSLLEIPFESMQEAEADWKTMLAHQVNELQEMNVYVHKFNLFLKSWFNSSPEQTTQGFPSNRGMAFKTRPI